jgi:hypothetical protein
VVIGIFLLLPVLLMVVYSFLTKEFRGGVIWDFTLAAYDQFFVTRGLFGDEPPTDRMDLHQHLLAVDLAGGAGHAPLPAHRLSDRLVHRHPARSRRARSGCS